MVSKVKVGIIGTGAISKAYINGCRHFEILDLVACSDLLVERAQAVAQTYNIPKASSVEEMLADPELQIVINLTIPKAHAEVSLAAIRAGKHVYSEKPLATTLEAGKQILDAARAQGVLTGCAPDTFLGGGGQTSRKLIDEGAIGEPVAAVGFWGIRWNGGPPARDFLFQRGAGPMLDMGPYYITGLVNLLGPIRRVSGSARVSSPERIVAEGPYKGRHIAMEAPTHVAGTLDFVSGPIGTVIVSNDIHWGWHLPFIEIYGTEGMLNVPDPNFHGGPVKIRVPGRDWEEVPLTHSDKVARGIGVADLAYAITTRRPARASGELGYHVLDVMTAFERSSDSNTSILIESQITQPAPLPTGLPEGELDS